MSINYLNIFTNELEVNLNIKIQMLKKMIKRFKMVLAFQMLWNLHACYTFCIIYKIYWNKYYSSESKFLSSDFYIYQSLVLKSMPCSWVIINKLIQNISSYEFTVIVFNEVRIKKMKTKSCIIIHVFARELNVIT